VLVSNFKHSKELPVAIQW